MPVVENPSLAGCDHSSDRVFSQLLSILLPRGRGLVIVLEAYFDESERTGGVFCVAGYAFIPIQARRFAKEWRRLFSPFGGFHMVDLVAGQEGFKNIGQSERDRLLREAIKIVNQRIAVGVAVSCSLSEVRALVPERFREFDHAYTICCYLSMSALGKWLDRNSLREDVAYVFESGHKNEAYAREFVSRIVQAPELKADCHHRADAFVPKADAVPLQAADLLAWEWAKCQDETVEQNIRPLRRSLRALFERDPDRYIVIDAGGPELRALVQHFADTGMLRG